MVKHQLAFNVLRDDPGIPRTTCFLFCFEKRSHCGIHIDQTALNSRDSPARISGTPGAIISILQISKLSLSLPYLHNEIGSHHATHAA